MNNLNLYDFFRDFVIPHHTSCGISSLEIEPLEDPRTKEDQILDEVLGGVEPMDSGDEGYQHASRVEPVVSKDEGD